MIPHTIHFAYTSPPGGGTLPFSFIHYLAIASAARYSRPERIVLHTLHDHNGPWWYAARRLAEFRTTSVPEELYNCRFSHPAHQADAIRLDVLRREGGIFLDLDVVSLRPYGDLLEAPGGALLGWEDDVAVCPAVVLAAPGAVFIERWIDGYNPAKSQWQGFRSQGRDEYWGEISTRYPAHLSRQHPNTVTLVPPHFFYPVHWRRSDCDRLFKTPEEGGLTTGDLDRSYAIHLWQTGTWSKRLARLAPQSVRSGGTVLESLLAPLI